MKPLPLCQKCQVPLPANSPEGLCPKCLVQAGLEDSLGPVDEEHEGEALPKVEEIAAHFPHLEIIKLVGHGGMGFVYKARQPGLDRFVCLKILSPRLSRDRSFAERFIREAKAMARLNHPNIISVHDFGITGGFFYFVMEFIDGMDLWQLEHAKRLAPAEALAIVSQVCDALQYAHDEGVIHRDIKPSNILLDKKGRVKIADFGLAKLLRLQHQPKAATLTQSRIVMGTPHYMAPEQMEKPLEVDHRADIYSMGVVFYEMLTGELPIGRFAPPSQKATLDARIDDVVLRALEKDPQQRYQKAGDVKNRVDTIIHKMPTPGETRMGAKLGSWNFGKNFLPWGFAAVNLVCVLALWWRLEHSARPLAQNAPLSSPIPSAGNSGEKMLPPDETILREEISRKQSTQINHSPETNKPLLASEPAKLPQEGFLDINLFNGKDLSGWNGDPNIWSVENNSIVARTPNDAPPNMNTCLIWQGGSVENFELRFRFRQKMLRGNNKASGGVIYRSHPSRKKDLSGYECRVEAGGGNVGILTSRDRTKMISYTQKTTISGNDGNETITADSNLIQMPSIGKLLKHDDWNECLIVAQGNHFTHSINGTVVADLTDENEKKYRTSGYLGLFVNTSDGRTMQMEFKDIQLRRLPQTTGTVYSSPSWTIDNPPSVTNNSLRKTIVMDNVDARIEGAWTTASFSPDRYDKDYKFASVWEGPVTASATYKPEFAAAGQYAVDIWYPKGDNRCTNAPLVISCADGEILVRVNQRIFGGQWVRIGKFNFNAGTEGFVRFQNNASTSGAVIVADGVRFVPVGSKETATAASIQESNISPSPAETNSVSNIITAKP